jgi:hypothetical protein
MLRVNVEVLQVHNDGRFYIHRPVHVRPNQFLVIHARESYFSYHLANNKSVDANFLVVYKNPLRYEQQFVLKLRQRLLFCGKWRLLLMDSSYNNTLFVTQDWPINCSGNVVLGKFGWSLTSIISSKL